MKRCSQVHKRYDFSSNNSGLETFHRLLFYNAVNTQLIQTGILR